MTLEQPNLYTEPNTINPKLHKSAVKLPTAKWEKQALSKKPPFKQAPDRTAPLYHDKWHSLLPLMNVKHNQSGFWAGDGLLGKLRW